MARIQQKTQIISLNKKIHKSSSFLKYLNVSLALLIEAIIILGILSVLQKEICKDCNKLWAFALVLILLWLGFMVAYYVIFKLRRYKEKSFHEVNHHKMIHNAVGNKHLLNRVLIGALFLLEILILGGLVLLIANAKNDTMYNLVSLSLLLVWFGILIAYYAWAIYFYNINLGLTNHDWAEIRAKNQHLPEGAIEVPSDNPHATQTLGLPPGTVRGSVALTLLIGGLAMAIAALGMDSVIKEDSFIVDHFDFFKTAFLMMIAFYFGNKSLEAIGYKSNTGTNAKGRHPDNNRTNNNYNIYSGNTVPTSPVTSNASLLKDQLRTNEEPSELKSDTGSSPKDQDDFNDPNAAQ